MLFELETPRVEGRGGGEALTCLCYVNFSIRVRSFAEVGGLLRTYAIRGKGVFAEGVWGGGHLSLLLEVEAPLFGVGGRHLRTFAIGGRGAFAGGDVGVSSGLLVGRFLFTSCF